MRPIKPKIESIMRGAHKAPLFSPASLLLALSLLYGRVVQLRSNAYRHGHLRSQRLGCPVISIGNVTVGGTGKTPLVIYLAEFLKGCGCKAAILTRGYKGRAGKNGVVVSNGQKILVTPETAGDEPFMMACSLWQVPVLTGKNRYKSGLKAIKEFAPDVILLDDGFQHLQLERDIDLVLMDSRHPFGNGHLLPRGILREPVSSLSRADAFIFTRAAKAAAGNCNGDPQKKPVYPPSRPVFTSLHQPYIRSVVKAGGTNPAPRQVGLRESCGTGFLRNRKVVAFSGIGDNREFHRTVAGFDCRVEEFLGFPDHHWYTQGDLGDILESVRARRAELLLTTAKDHARMASKAIWPVDLVVVDIKMDFGMDKLRFNEFIRRRLDRLRSGSNGTAGA